MWIRSDLKKKAKTVLRNIYCKAFLVSLVIAFASGNGGGNSGTKGDKTFGIEFGFEEGLLIGAILAIAIGITVIFRIFVCYPLLVGGRRYYIKSSHYENNKKCFTFAFMGKNYGGIVLSMLLKDIQNFLWFLLLIIPGIIKAYAYRMVPYILADNPNIGAKKAIKLSCDMTRGHKFNIFVLDLSFILWYILGLLALGVGVFFVFPYHHATEAELYKVLKNDALDKNYYIEEDFPLEESVVVE